MTALERFDQLKKKYRYDAEAAAEKIRFIEEHCRHVEGDLDGQPLILPDAFKDEILRPIFGLKRANGKRLIRKVYIQMPRKNAKALDVDTPIPTPDGWKKMLQIKQGDYVFGDDGRPAKVLHTSYVMEKESYHVDLQGGESIVASADHLWEIRCNDWRGSGSKVVTTEYINDHYKRRGSGELIMHIKTCRPADYDRKHLLIDPYVLGCWLGDGHSRGSRITIDRKDAEIAGHIRDAGYSTTHQPAKERADNYKIGGYSELSTQLRSYNLLQNKHIPDPYLQASIDQRTELLQGLMDTDGTISPVGQCKYTGTNKQLVDDVYELVLSLGFKATYRTTDARCQNGSVSTCYNVGFFADTPVFKLKRKLQRQKPRIHKRSKYRSIVDVRPAGIRPVKCIMVDSDSQLYLAGRHFIPTHNTTMMAAVELALLFNDSEASAQIYNCAGDDEQAGLLFNAAKKMVAKDPMARKLSKTYQASIIYKDSFIKKITSKSDTKHGFNSHAWIYDELHVAKNKDLYDVLNSSTGQRSNPLGIIITTPGTDKLSICYYHYSYSQKLLSGSIEDDTYWCVIYESDPQADILDPKTWEIANPLYKYSENLRESIADEAKAVANDPANENSFRRLRLGQWTSSETKWIKTEFWTSLTGDVSRQNFEGDMVWLGLDLSSTSDLTSLCELYYSAATGIITPFWNIWIPEKAAEEYEKQFNIPYSRWEKDGFIHIVSGNTISFSAVEDRILEIDQTNEVRVIAYDEWNSRDLATRCEEKHGIKTMAQRQGFGLSNALKKTKDMIISAKVLHSGNPVVSWTFDNIYIKENDEGNIKIVKPQSANAGGDRRDKKIDPWISIAMAVNEWMIDVPPPSVYSTRGVISI